MDELALVPTGVVQETTRVIIDSIWTHFEREASNAISQLRDEDKFETLLSVDFSRFLHEIKAHSKHCPDYILKKLIDWRQQRQLSVNHKFDSDPAIENPVRSLYSIAVNIIYVRSVLMVVTAHNIAPELSVILQSQAFQCFCDVVPLQRTNTVAMFASKILNKPSINTDYYNTHNRAPIAQKRRLLFNLWSTLIGFLSQTQLESISLRFQDVMEESDRDSPSAKARIIRGMRSIKLNLSDIPSITKSYNLIRYILSVFDNCHSPEMKRAVGETLTLILYPLAEQIPLLRGGLSVREWWKTVYDVYVMAEHWSKKRKYHSIALPLMMSALCVMEKESFLSHRLMCCNKIYKFSKESTIFRSIALACVRRILETYLRHFADEQIGTEIHLQNLNNQILFESKWDESVTHQDGIVAYVLTIAERKPALALATIVASCLETGAKNRHCLAGLRALNGILYGQSADISIENRNISMRTPVNRTAIVITNVDSDMHCNDTHVNDEESDRSDLLQASDDTIETTYGPNLSNVLKTLLNKLKPVSENVLEPGIERILCVAISQILRETKHVMLRHGSINASATLYRAGDGAYLEMFRLCILCLPKLHLWSSLINERDEYDVISTSDLIYLLAMSSICAHKNIASSAQQVLTHLMERHPELRCNILQDTSTYLLQQHGDNVTNITTLLNMLDQFMQIWLNQRDDTKTMMDISKVEAACIFSLTSTASIVRQAALNLTQLCAELGRQQPKTTNTTNSRNPECKTDDAASSGSQSFVLHIINNRWPDVRLQEIIDATENDIKQRFKHQYKSRSDTEIKSKSIYDLANGESAEDQLEWTMCLGAILQKAVPKRCKCLKFAYENGKVHVEAVLKYINNNEFDENMIGIWTNFVLFVTICVAIIDPIPAAAEELFQKLIPLLSMDRPDIQFMGALSLGKIDPTMILTLMKCLESIQHSVFSLRKKPKHFIRLLQNLAYIYRFLAEDVEKSTILQSETIRERMISFVEKTMKFMEEFRANLRQDCLTIRIHFCIIVRNLLEKWPTICTTQNNKDGLDPIPARLRRRLFDFMISWSGQNQRKNNNFHSLKSTTATTKSIIKHRALPVDIQQSEQQKLEFSALAAIAALLRGQSFELEVNSLRDGVVFKWIRTVVASEDPQVAMLGSLALQSYLSCNYEKFQDFIEECYNNNHIISKTFFVVLCQVWLSEHFNIPKPVLFHLTIYKMGDISMRVRSAALKIGREIPSLMPPDQPINPLNFIISSRLPDSYILGQYELSRQLAAAYPSLSEPIIREFGDRLNEAELSYVGVMLNYMIPWLKNIDLSGANDNTFVMNILFRATIDYGTQYAHQITNVWKKGLTFKQDNIAIVLDYVLRRCEYDIEYEKWVAIEASKRIALYCSRTCRKNTIQHLIRIIRKQSVSDHNSDLLCDDEILEDEEGNINMNGIINDHQLPEDPRTSLSTPAPPSYKHKVKSNINIRHMQSPFRSPLFSKEQLELVANVGFGNDQTSDASDIVFEEEIRHNLKLLKQESINFYNNPINDTRHCNSSSSAYADCSAVQCLNITKGDYALMLLVELAYEMDISDEDFTENIALMLHVAILGLDHPFRSLGEHCKRLLMNLIHSIYFREHQTSESQLHSESAQQLMLYLVSKRGKTMWRREMIDPRQLFLTSSKYLQFLVQWLVDVIISDPKCSNIALIWGNAAIEWIEKCTSSFIACRSAQIYRSLQPSFESKFNAEVFQILMSILQDTTKVSLWSEILILLKTWTTSIPLSEVETWNKLIWNTVNICKYNTNETRSHVYVHGLSLLAGILQFLDLTNDKTNNIWDYVSANNIGIDSNKFEGIQSLVVRGLLCDITRKQSEQFLSGLTLMENHDMICSKSGRIHCTVIAQLPGICHHLQHKLKLSPNSHKHMQCMARSIATLFFKLSMKEIAIPFDNIHALDNDALLSKVLKPIAEWISVTDNADMNSVKLLLDLLDHSDTEYRRHVLCILHGILLWIDWSESELSQVESNFFDRITDLLATNLWREATMILEVVVKFNNNSSESPSVLFSPHPNILVSPPKRLLSLDPHIMTEQSLELTDTHSHKSGQFNPSKVSKDMPPFSPNNMQRRKNGRWQRRYSSDMYASPPNQSFQNSQSNNNSSDMNDGQQMVSAALASWQLVVTETRNEECCSPLPPQKMIQNCEQKAVAQLLEKSSIAFKAHKDELDNANKEKPAFSARRSLGKLLTLSGLKKESNCVNNSFCRLNVSNINANNNNNITIAPLSRGDSLNNETEKEKGKENVNINSNPYIDHSLIAAQQHFNPIKNKAFENEHNLVIKIENEFEDSVDINTKPSKSAKRKRGKWTKDVSAQSVTENGENASNVTE